jgi:hypothetical protein
MFYFVLYVFAVLSITAGMMHHPPLGQTLRWLAPRKTLHPHKLTETPVPHHGGAAPGSSSSRPHTPTWARTDLT